MTKTFTALLIAAATTAGCGGGGADSESSGERQANGYVVFGMTDTEALRSSLTPDDGDETNDTQFLMMLEAGGIGAYMDLPEAERDRLQAQYVLPTERRVYPLSGFATPDAVTACLPYLAPQHRSKTHRLGGLHVYSVDSVGRSGQAVASIRDGSISAAIRDSCSTVVGSWGAAPAGTPTPVNGYVGGHLIAASIGGSPARINLTPQSQQINASTFPRVESAVRFCGSNPTWMVDYSITPRYSTSSPLTPDSYVVWIRVLRNTGWWMPGGPQGGEGSIIIANHSENLTSINAAVDAYTAAIRAACP